MMILKGRAIFLALLLLSLPSIVTKADADVSITFDLNTGDVVASGSYVLLDATTSHSSDEVLLPTESGDWLWITNGAGTALTPTVGNASVVSLSVATGLLNWNITDTSNGNTVITSNEVDSFYFIANSPFIGLSDRDFADLPASVDAGDLFNIAGNFTLSGSELAKLSAFSLGSHVSTYNAQTLTLTFIPEPTSALLLLIGAFGAVIRRRR